MMRRMSSRLFTKWMIYARLEPFGADQDWLRAGTIAAVTANTMRDPDQRSEPYQATDFMPVIGGDDEEAQEPGTWVDMDVEDQVSFIEILNAAFGGTDLRQTQ